jgi:DnaJ-class molecular chaperone
MVNFLDIDKARRILGLHDEATLKEIKAAYRKMAKKHHPDRHIADKQDDVIMKEVNWAYRILENYCKDYKYSFNLEAVARTYPDEEYIRTWRDRWYQSI